MQRLLISALLSLSALGGSVVLAAGGGGMSAPSPSIESRAPSPEEIARSAYNDGVRAVKKADEYTASAATATDAGKKEKLTVKSAEALVKAFGKFSDAVEADSTMYQAWNYLGYIRRKQGDYAAALESYDKALSLNAQYGEAIEYRGVAYLALKRVDDAKSAYLTLFASNRALANKLLLAMQEWVVARHAAADGVDPKAIDEFSKWVDERGSIAKQTASLTRAGAAASWR